MREPVEHDQARDLARQDVERREVELAQPAKLAPDPERLAIGLADWRTLRYRLARPELARHMIPWRPRVPNAGGICVCGKALGVADRAGHAVEREVLGVSACVAWCLGLPLDARP